MGKGSRTGNVRSRSKDPGQRLGERGATEAERGAWTPFSMGQEATESVTARKPMGYDMAEENLRSNEQVQPDLYNQQPTLKCSPTLSNTAPKEDPCGSFWNEMAPAPSPNSACRITEWGFLPTSSPDLWPLYARGQRAGSGHSWRRIGSVSVPCPGRAAWRAALV